MRCAMTASRSSSSVATSLQTDILDAALKGADGVFHFAALWLLQCHEFPRAAFDVNVRGTFNVMEACVGKRRQAPRLLARRPRSTAMRSTEPMTEDHPFNNKNFYGATKICGEAMLRAFHHRYGLDYVGLRYMNVYGPRQDYHGAYIAVIMKMLDAHRPRRAARSSRRRQPRPIDFVSVEDCAAANVCAMRADTTDRFYNVGTGTRTSMKELAEMLLEITGCRRRHSLCARSGRRWSRNRIGSTERARDEIGFERADQPRGRACAH